MAGFCGRFIERFSLISEPIHALKHMNVRFVWGKAQQTAYERFKEALSTPSILQIPDFSHEFTVVCDASDIAFSAVLHQKQGKVWPQSPVAAGCCHLLRGGIPFTRRSVSQWSTLVKSTVVT
jgi:hypothetical protein